MARAAALSLLVFALLAAPAAGAQGLRERLGQDLRRAGPATGAHALDLTTGRVRFSKRADIPRVMMSNTKLFTTGAALEKLGPRRRFATTALGARPLSADGTLAGDLYLRGGGDPTFDDAPARELVARLQAAGLRHVAGSVVGDGSLFDSQLGPPGWQLNDTPPGPVSALQFNRGIEAQDPIAGPQYSTDPPALAAAGLNAALVTAGITVDGAPATGLTPQAARPLAAIESPPLATLVRLINKPSDNLFAETLARLLGGKGTMKAGVKAALRFGRKLGVKAEIHTGSGAFPYPRAAPRQLVRLLVALRKLPTFAALKASLPVAGRDGTLADRMRNGPAEGRCQAKTGSNFSRVQAEQASVLSGYCRTLRGHLVVFSLMMNAVPDVLVARRLQDRMVEAIVR
jgi:D-alanyl-D-alanine carboxypeptidase/D-alanyl-D-alanine-endopeptidase (penicillin-binding protein 4)